MRLVGTTCTTMFIKPLRLIVALLLTNIALSAYGQSLIIQDKIMLPKDSVLSAQLITSLKGFLDQRDKPNRENTFVQKDDLPETSSLLDELKGMEQNADLKDKNYYKCYLTNAVELNNGVYMVQLSFMGTANGQPVLGSSFSLLAKRSGGQFYFNSPLRWYTQNWKHKTLANTTYYFKDTINNNETKFYQKTLAYYNQKLGASTVPCEFYWCDNFQEVQHLLGIEYKLIYNGYTNLELDATENGKKIMVNGMNTAVHRVDPHDLWHSRLHSVVPVDMINRPVDEGTAYLYGGSWGFTWQQILVKFKAFIALHPDADWLKLYLDGTNFEPGPKIMKVSYMFNALIAKKLEVEKGFSAVKELITCGKKEDGDANYFKILDKVAGINKSNFNAKMNELIKAENLF